MTSKINISLYNNLIKLRRMYTEEDLLSVKKVYQQPHERNQTQSNDSSVVEDNSLQELYFSRYFLNNSFKILHIDIVGTEQVCSYQARYDSFIIYIIRVITQDFSYEVKKRYNQFLKLYQKIKSFESYKVRMLRTQLQDKTNFEIKSNLNYKFPTKKISSSVKNFFKLSNKLTLASQRKSQLRIFLNQIRNNYAKFSDYFMDDYVELLKFLNTKQQHKKYWKLKEGRFVELFQTDLKNMNHLNTGNLNKNNNQNNTFNIDYLTELLQHQINKINLAVVAKNQLNKLSKNLSEVYPIGLSKDPMVNEQIIKNVQSIKDIVLELKKRINYDHIRCIMKGKDIKQTVSSMQNKKGLVEFSLKYSTNQLVSIHIIKVVIDVFLNSEFNYSYEAFLKIFSEIQMQAVTLNQQKQKLALDNKQFRESYFKLINQYIHAKTNYGTDKKYMNGSQQFPFSKIMSVMLYSIYLQWNSKCQKNREFKLKDEQKQWGYTSQNLGQSWNIKKSYFIPYQQDQNINFQFVELENVIENKQDVENSKKNRKQTINQIRTSIRQILMKQIKKFNNQNIKMSLRTHRAGEYSYYLLRSQINDKSFQTCLQIMKNEKKWNKLLVSTHIDIYSNTRKDFIKLPEKHQKIFRFTQQEEIDMDLPSSEEEKQFESIVFENISVENQQQISYSSQLQKNPKMSTQTMPSTSGSCAHDHQPDKNQNISVDIGGNKLSQKINVIKSPPNETISNSYFQCTKVERIIHKKKQFCLIEVELILLESSTRKYFTSQIQGETSYIWQGFKNTFLE